MKRSVIYLIYSFCFTTIFSQIGNDAYFFALQQFEKDNYTVAAKEFNRAIFLGTDYNADCFSHIAECYENQNAYDLSDIFYDKAYFALNDDSLKTQVLLRKAYSNILRKRFTDAFYELVNIDSLYGVTQNDDFWLYLGVTYYGMEEFSKAESSFMHTTDSVGSLQLAQAFAYLNKMQKRHRPPRVETMSYILPGLGQMHTGNIKAGINSTLLIGALFYGMVKVGLVYSGFDGLFLFAPWVQRYYMGGAEKAKHMAEHKLADIKNDVFNQILDIENEND